MQFRIVIKSVPPFLVVHTNAAYCRLSGIDSHAAVGKPISNLLSLPDQQMLVEAVLSRVNFQNIEHIFGNIITPTSKVEHEQTCFFEFWPAVEF